MNETSLRVPPHSMEAEASVIGALLLDNRGWEQVGDQLTESDFYRHEHRLIFAAIAKLAQAGKEADVITTFVALERMAEDAGGLIYLNQLAQGVSGASNIRHYAAIVRDRAIQRKLATAGDEIAASAFDTDGRDVGHLLDDAQQRILTVGQARTQTEDWVSVYAGMVEHSAVLERRHSGESTAWPTGLHDLDELLDGGLRPGTLVIVGGRPSMGKTALGLTIGAHMAESLSVGLLSMEMSRMEVCDRLTAMLGRVSMSAVKRPAKGAGLAWDRVAEGIEKAQRLRLHISDQGGLSIHQVRSKARAIKRLHGLDVLIVDYIGLMAGLDTKANRNAQLGEISRGLKTLAKELQVCVLCLAQLNRKAEERSAGMMPQLSDLRDSGEIEQDADVIIFIKRPIMANPDLGNEWSYYAKASVAKNRQGACGVLNLSYLGEQTRFAGWEGPPPQAKYQSGGGL